MMHFYKKNLSLKVIQNLKNTDMAERAQGYLPYGEAGDGTYEATLGPQACTTLAPIQEYVVDLARTIPFTQGDTVFNMGDYGAADGMSSLSLIQDLISSLKARLGSKVQFQVFYEDKPTNDFNSLFKHLYGMLPSPNSYLLETENVFAFASGNDFHKQCVPLDSMHLIISAVAVQWMSQRIIPYKKSIYIDSNVSEEELNALKKQSKADWENFLLVRNKELKIGGLLVVVCIGRIDGENGQITHTNHSIISIFTRMWSLFRDTGKITNEEFIDTNFMECPYTLAELRSPFQEQDSPVSKSGLRLLSSDMKIIPCMFYEAWKQKKDADGTDDREGFARTYLAAQWNWANSTFHSGLSVERSESEKTRILEEFYCVVEKEIMKRNPEDFKDDVMLSYTVIQKQRI